MSSHSPDGPTPAARAIALLARREHSRLELIRKLVARGVEATEAAVTVDDLAARDYQSDARYADMLVRTRIADGCGPLRIAADLRIAGVDAVTGESVVASQLEHQEVDWIGVARELLRRRGLDGKLDQSRLRRAFALLQRRGFASDTIRTALRGENPW